MLAARMRANDVVSRATMRHADNWLLWRLTAEYRLYRNYRDLCDSRPDEPIVVPRTELFSANLLAEKLLNEKRIIWFGRN